MAKALGDSDSRSCVCHKVPAEPASPEGRTNEEVIDERVPAAVLHAVPEGQDEVARGFPAHLNQ